MFLINSSFRKAVSLIVAVIISSVSLLNAQDSSYSGVEEVLNSSDLVLMANKISFGENLCESFHKDVKNTYYAVNASALNSKFEKIRLLELSYANDAIVNIGMSDDGVLYLYLVNNTLGKTNQTIQDLFSGFAIQAKEELEKMNDEQLRLWLIQHDKYFKK